MGAKPWEHRCTESAYSVLLETARSRRCIASLTVPDSEDRLLTAASSIRAIEPEAFFGCSSTVRSVNLLVVLLACELLWSWSRPPYAIPRQHSEFLPLSFRWERIVFRSLCSTACLLTSPGACRLLAPASAERERASFELFEKNTRGHTDRRTALGSEFEIVVHSSLGSGCEPCRL